MQKYLGRHRGSGVVAAIALSTVLVACGGNGGSAAGDADRSAIKALLVRHYKAPSCADLTTTGRTAFGHPVDDAACATDIRTQVSKDVSVSKVDVKGDVATAVADSYTFKLVRVSGAWLIAG